MQGIQYKCSGNEIKSLKNWPLKGEVTEME